MRDVPELTFRGALGVLGHYDRPVLDRLNTLLGGLIMVAGAALTGLTAAPVVAIAALWGWVDQKNEALGLVRKLLERSATAGPPPVATNAPGSSPPHTRSLSRVRWWRPSGVRRSRPSTSRTRNWPRCWRRRPTVWRPR